MIGKSYYRSSLFREINKKQLQQYMDIYISMFWKEGNVVHKQAYWMCNKCNVFVIHLCLLCRKSTGLFKSKKYMWCSVCQENTTDPVRIGYVDYMQKKRLNPAPTYPCFGFGWRDSQSYVCKKCNCSITKLPTSKCRNLDSCDDFKYKKSLGAIVGKWYCQGCRKDVRLRLISDEEKYRLGLR